MNTPSSNLGLPQAEIGVAKSETEKLEETIRLSGVEISELRALLDQLRRLFSGEFRHLVKVPLDAMLTTEQMAKWFQLSAKEINLKARAGILPGVPISKTRFRFHPRSILEHGHAIFANKKRR